MSDTTAANPVRHLRTALWVLAATYGTIGLVMMLVASPKVPYADSWRFLTHFLETPFPANVIGADNGHREVLPNAIRVAELHWLDANQWLQVLLGLYMAVLVTVGLLRATRTGDKDLQAASAATIAIGIFWLGNSRKIAHGSESIHLFMVLLCLVLGVRRLLTDDPNRTWHAGALGLLATVSFGSGAASFAAFFAVMWLRRDPWQQHLRVLAFAAVGALLMLLGTTASGSNEEPTFLTHVDHLLRWLGAPFAWVLSPALDPAHAQRLPLAPLRAVLEPVATLAQDSFGPARMHRWPGALFGGLAVLWLIKVTLRARLRRDSDAVRLFAIGLAWFGLAVGLLVVLARSSYFVTKPDQIVAQRYLPWSMVMWCGLLLTFVHREAGATRHKLLAVLFVALAFAPSQIWTGRYAFRRQATAEQTAVAMAVGVLDTDYPMVENVPTELQRAAPLLAARKKTVWSWPEIGLLGQNVPDDARKIAAADLSITPITNLFAGIGCDVHFRSSADATLLLLVDDRGTVRGVAMPDADPQRWLGWVRGNHTRLRVFAR